MFHHFHDNKMYPNSPGSLNKNQLRKIIKFIGRKNIITPKEFIYRLQTNDLKNKICFTFDDALRCQYDIAQKVLDEFNIKAFYFIQTSIFDKKKDFSEVYRFFRNNFYNNVNKFYKDFKFIINKFKKKNYEEFLYENKDLIIQKKKLYPFYSTQDVEFRLLRDNFLNKKEYKKIMLEMFKIKKCNYKQIFTKAGHKFPTISDLPSFVKDPAFFSCDELVVEDAVKMIISNSTKFSIYQIKRYDAPRVEYNDNNFSNAISHIENVINSNFSLL